MNVIVAKLMAIFFLFSARVFGQCKLQPLLRAPLTHLPLHLRLEARDAVVLDVCGAELGVCPRPPPLLVLLRRNENK